MGVFGNTFGNSFGSQGALVNQTPVSPTLLVVTAVSDVSIDLAWTINATGQDGHRIYISTNGTTFTEKGTVLGLTATYSVTGLAANTLYYFYLVAYKGNNESDPSNTVSGTTWNAIFNGLTRAWPLTESGMRRDALGSGDDFYPVGVTSVNGYTVFDGIDDYIAVGDGAYALGSDTSFTFAFKIKPTGVSGTKFIMTKGFQSNAANCEWYLYRSGNQLIFRLSNGSATVDISDSTHRLSAGTETKVIIGFDAVNNFATMKIDNNAPVSVAYTTGTVHNYGGIIIGTDGTRAVGNFFDGGIKDLMYWTGTYLDATQQSTLFTSWIPCTSLLEQGITVDPDTLLGGYSRHDISDLTRLYSDTAKTVNVSSDDDPIRVIASKWNTHDWTAPSDSARPLYKTNILGGLGSALWNGSNSEVDFDAAIPGDADFTLFLLARNTDNASGKGSQILNNSAAGLNYLSLTGTDYSNGNYGVIHTTNGSAISSPPLSNPTGFTLIEVTRKGNLYSISQNGKFHAVNSVGIIGGDILYNKMGGEFAAGWWFEGYFSEEMTFTRALTSAERARVRATLSAKWTIPNIFFMQC